MRALKDSYLYGIVDLGYVKPEDVPNMTQALVKGGVDLLQLRAKKFTPAEVERLARLMHPITRDGGIPLIINDHPEVAAAVGSEGVHVGQDDQGVDATRSIVGPECFVGKSTHSVAQARAAMAEGADYIGFGPLYATGTKPDYVPIGLQDIAEVHAFATCPVFCIGGVNPERLPEIVEAGAKRVVVVSAWLQAEDVRGAVEALRWLRGPQAGC
ncbi:thiamine phosphate synthase [Verrucomicrobium spinosum]|uniref:thiamine phosphate synthase n=1 Tax=Verrucomicrobium spinosum TaxID=2736 RepID=UPI0001745112|nr:thiamine phosphate synthase [Verrucomicrobium spinosum]